MTTLLLLLVINFGGDVKYVQSKGNIPAHAIRITQHKLIDCDKNICIPDMDDPIGVLRTNDINDI